MPGVWPSVQMGFITLHSTTAPLGPNAAETITFQLKESQVVDKPNFQDTLGGGFQGIPREFAQYVQWISCSNGQE